MYKDKRSKILHDICKYHIVVKLLEVMSSRTDFKGKTFWWE